MVSFLLSFTATFGLAWTSSFAVFCILRFIIGAAVVGSYVTGFVLGKLEHTVLSLIKGDDLTWGLHIEICSMKENELYFPMTELNNISCQPPTASCRLFLKQCTLTNKSVGTALRVLSKPLQRRQGPELRHV